MVRTIQLVLLAIWAVLPASIVVASTCDQAASAAAAETGIPVDLLRAITRVETGRSQDGANQPWPWTVNFDGKGHFFDHPDEAMDYVQGLIDQGETVIDVGCFQMNVKWHSRRFQSLEDMFDPFSNARAAADFIGQLHNETGNWEDAVGKYHSRTPKRAHGYAQKVATVLAELVNTDAAPVDIDMTGVDVIQTTDADWDNSPPEAGYQPVNRRSMTISYPFLQGGQTASPGSVVPMGANILPLIGG
jgi:hypothetical protein